MPSEGIQGDEWDAYVTLFRATGTNVGSPTGREPQGDGGPEAYSQALREFEEVEGCDGADDAFVFV